MANLSITISNAIGLYGPAPPMLWGVDSWGTLWGAGTQDTVTNANKLLTNAVPSDSAISLVATFNRTIANTLAFLEDLTGEGMTDGSGYSLVYPGNATNAENRVISTYSAAAAASTTYSSGSAGTTTWS